MNTFPCDLLNRALLFVALALVPASVRAQVALGDAVDATNLVWTSGGSAVWARQAGVTHDRVDAAQSGAISDGQDSWLQTTVTGPGTVVFWWKVSSEGEYDLLELYIGASRQSQISGEQDWQQLAFNVPSGNQTLRWRYVKDIGTNLGEDRGWVDEVRFVPSTGPPVILIHPSSQTVLTGVTARLQVGVGGRQPISYRWLRDETNVVSTSATLTLSNVQLTNAGEYRVVVTNLDGSVSSSNALLTVTTLGEANNILLLVDHQRVSPYESALTNQGRAYRRFDVASELSFNLAVESADPGRSLVLVDTAEWGHSLNYVERFVRAGGRAILQYVHLGLAPGSTAPAAFHVSVAQSLSSPPPVYNWGGSTFFSGVASAISFQDIYLTDGQKLQPFGGARAVAGFVSAQTVNEAAVVIGNSNRTIVNGFVLATATSVAAASRLAQNQIEYLLGPPAPAAPQISVQPEDLLAVEGATPSFFALPSGTPPLRYQWYFNQTNALDGATNATLLIPSAGTANIGEYQIVVTNLQGAVTSRVAVLTLTTNGPVQTVLLLNDYVSTIYETALGNLGLNYQRFNADGGSQFSLAVRSAHPGTTLVIVDAVDRVFDLSAVERFVRSGGLAIVEYLNLQAGSLAAALQLSAVQPLSTAPPVYNWGGSTFFDGVSSPLTLSDTFIISGQRLQPAEGAHVAAGFVSSPSANMAAVVTGNSGRTIVNGFALEEVTLLSAATRLAQNEVLHLISLTRPAPFMVRQPQDRTVVEGATASIEASVGGRQPLHYQWYLNQTNALANATNATLVLSNVPLTAAGPYQVVVTNLFGSVTSRVALLNVIPLGAVTTVLLFNDFTFTIYESALSGLNLSYQRFSDDFSFNAAVRGASLGTTLVVVDAVANAGRDFSAVEEFARSGGRVILQYLDMQAGSLSAALGVATVQPFTDPSPVYDWDGSNFFEGVAAPLTFVDFFIRSGQRLTPVAGGQAAAGFVSSPTAGQAAVVLGNSGRTIVNGFAMEEVTSPSAAIRLVKNEVVHLISLGDPVPRIVGQPADQVVIEGATASFAVSAAGSRPLRYQWYLGQANALPGATNTTLILSNAQMADAGGYYVVVSNLHGAVTTRVAILTVNALGPVANALLFNDYSGTIYESALNGAGVPYQRFSTDAEFNAAVRSASPGTTLVVVDAVAAPGRDFSAVEEFVRSGGRAILQYLDLQAGSLSAAFGLAGVQPFTDPSPVYDWGGSGLFNGVATPLTFVDSFIRSGQRLTPVAGAQAAAGFVSSPTAGQAAVVIGSSGRTIVNGFAMEEVTAPSVAIRLAQNEVEFFFRGPPVISQPQDVAVPLGATTNFSVTARGIPPLTYQWHKDGGAIAGATSRVYSITGVQSNHLGGYSVVVSNPLGVVTSRVARLDLAIVPVFVQHPLSQSIVVGGSVTFSVEITGNPLPFGYEWRKSATPLVSNTASSRVTFYTLSNVQPADAGVYRVVVRNAARPSGVPSSLATLTVLADSDGDGLPDAWETAYPACADPAQDCDHDGLTNLEEYRAGTDPTDAASVLRIDHVTAGNSATLEFPVVANQTYTVQYSDDLESAGWLKLADVVARTTNGNVRVTDPGAAPHRSYRLVTPRQP